MKRFSQFDSTPLKGLVSTRFFVCLFRLAYCSYSVMRNAFSCCKLPPLFVSSILMHCLEFSPHRFDFSSHFTTISGEREKQNYYFRLPDAKMRKSTSRHIFRHLDLMNFLASFEFDSLNFLNKSCIQQKSTKALQ